MRFEVDATTEPRAERNMCELGLKTYRINFTLSSKSGPSAQFLEKKKSKSRQKTDSRNSYFSTKSRINLPSQSWDGACR